MNTISSGILFTYVLDDRKPPKPREILTGLDITYVQTQCRTRLSRSMLSLFMSVHGVDTFKDCQWYYYSPILPFSIRFLLQYTIVSCWTFVDWDRSLLLTTSKAKSNTFSALYVLYVSCIVFPLSKFVLLLSDNMKRILQFTWFERLMSSLHVVFY